MPGLYNAAYNAHWELLYLPGRVECGLIYGDIVADEREAGGVLVYLFDRGLVSVNKNDCNLPIFNLLLLADDERVAIVDGGLHALAGHTQGEILTAARLLL